MALNARQLEGVGTLYPIAACRHHDLVVAIEGEVKRGSHPPAGRSPPSEKRVGRRSSPVGFMSSRLRMTRYRSTNGSAAKRPSRTAGPTANMRRRELFA